MSLCVLCSPNRTGDMSCTVRAYVLTEIARCALRSPTPAGDAWYGRSQTLVFYLPAATPPRIVRKRKALSAEEEGEADVDAAAGAQGTRSTYDTHIIYMPSDLSHVCPVCCAPPIMVWQVRRGRGQGTAGRHWR